MQKALKGVKTLRICDHLQGTGRTVPYAAPAPIYSSITERHYRSSHDGNGNEIIPDSASTTMTHQGKTVMYISLTKDGFYITHPVKGEHPEGKYLTDKRYGANEQTSQARENEG